MPPVRVDLMMSSHGPGQRLPHDDSNSKGVAFIHSKYCTMDEASVPLFDMGFFQGDATYEVMTVSNGRYFRLADHFERLAQSCKTFRLQNPFSDSEMREIFDTLIASAGLVNASVFWCVTRGMPKPGAHAASDRNNPDAFINRFYAAAYPYAGIVTQAQREAGLDIMINGNHIRIHPKAVDPSAKNFHWMDMKLSLFEARDQGRDWCVLPDGEGFLTECAGANIFVIKNGEIYTPASGCLQGITRKSVLELAKIADIPTHVDKVHVDQLRAAEDAFMTSSAGGVMPIRAVDGVPLNGARNPDAISARLHNLYWEKMWGGWNGTPVGYKGK